MRNWRVSNSPIVELPKHTKAWNESHAGWGVFYVSTAQGCFPEVDGNKMTLAQRIACIKGLVSFKQPQAQITSMVVTGYSNHSDRQHGANAVIINFSPWND